MTEPRRVVDALGTYCPVPVALAARAAARLPTGGVIELLADDPLIEVDLPAWCHSDRHRLESLDREGEVYRALVRVGSEPAELGGPEGDA